MSTAPPDNSDPLHPVVRNVVQTAESFSDTVLFDWKQASFRTDLVFLIAIAICLGVGIAAGSPGAGMIAAGGAFTVGFGAKYDIDGSRLVPMMLAAFGMSLSTFAGMVAGHDEFLVVVIVAAWAFGYGMLLNREPAFLWVGQQAVVFLLIATAFPFSPKAAFLRALLVFAGGTLQILVTSAVLHTFRELASRIRQLAQLAQQEEAALRATIKHVAHSLRERSFVDSPVPFALRVMFVLALGTEIYRRYHFASGYWIPMTSLLVLKPGVFDTVNRAVARVLGTIAGAALLTLLLAHININPIELAVFTVLFAWLAYSTLHVNYLLFTAFLTSYIVFLLALNHLPQGEIARNRSICTLIGGALALVVRVIVIARRKKERQEADISEANLSAS